MELPVEHESSISINENSVKTHINCFKELKVATEHQTASQIIDAVYDGRPEVIVESEYDTEKSKTRNWFIYKTNQGTIKISFKTKVIVIHSSVKLTSFCHNSSY